MLRYGFAWMEGWMARSPQSATVLGFWASACTSASAPGQRQGSATSKPGRGSVPVEFISGPTRIFGPGLKTMVDHCHRGWAPRYQPIEDWGGSSVYVPRLNAGRTCDLGCVCIPALPKLSKVVCSMSLDGRGVKSCSLLWRHEGGHVLVGADSDHNSDVMREGRAAPSTRCRFYPCLDSGSSCLPCDVKAVIQTAEQLAWPQKCMRLWSMCSKTLALW